MTGWEILALICGGLALAAALFSRLSSRLRIQDAPDESIPTQDEMHGLQKRVLSGDDEVMKYWFRGAVYYESQRIGFGTREALEMALDPDLNQVGFRAERV